MGFGLILTGLIFFFNPFFNLLDVLPDFIGCVFIICGLSRLSQLDGNLEAARNNAKYLLWVSAAKLICAFWTNAGHSSYLLPFTFCFAVLEAMLMLFFFRNLYAGIEYTASRNTSSHVLDGVSSAGTMSAIFVIATRILDFIPQIPPLISQDEQLDLSHNAMYKMPLTQLIPYIKLACIICCALLGILYLIVTARFFSGLLRDRGYIDALKAKYTSEILSDRRYVVNHALKRAYFFLITGSLFFFDFSVDAINVIPNTVGFILIFAAIQILCSLCKRKSPVLLYVIGTAVSLLNYVCLTFTRLGINYLYGVETFNAREFPPLESNMSITVEAILSFTEYALFAVSVIYVLSLMKCIFASDNRPSAIPMLTVAKINCVVMGLFCAIRNTLVPAIGHFASHAEVYTYVQTKSLIHTEQALREAMSQPLVARFERLDSFAYGFSIFATVFTLWCVLYLMKINRTSESGK